MTGGAGNDDYVYTANGQSFTANAVVDNAFDVITGFTVNGDDLSFGAFANGGGSLAFGSTGADFSINYVAGRVYVIETGEANVAAVDGDTAGADGGAGTVAIVIYNTTAADIDLSGAGVANTLAATLEAAAGAGLQMFALDATAGQDYGTINGDEFIFA